MSSGDLYRAERSVHCHCHILSGSRLQTSKKLACLFYDLGPPEVGGPGSCYCGREQTETTRKHVLRVGWGADGRVNESEALTNVQVW